MKVLDHRNEESLDRLLSFQVKHSWDINERIDWDLGIDHSKAFLPTNNWQQPLASLRQEERIVLSQFLGIIIASTISQMERAAIDLKNIAWEPFLKNHTIGPSMEKLGEHFFEEEEKHSIMFQRYIDKFAHSINMDPVDFAKVLPTTKLSFSKLAYKLNAKFGGMAMWWLISSLEEESVDIFRKLAPHRSLIDPLYLQIHEAHFEEEMRHKSYAIFMLNHFYQDSQKWNKAFFRKIDFALAESLNIFWTIRQIVRFKKVKKYRNHHPFFATLTKILEEYETHSLMSQFKLLIYSTPFVSESLQLSSYKNIASMKKEFGALNSPFTWKTI